MPQEVPQEDTPREETHQEAVPREEEDIPKPREEEGEAKDMQRTEGKIAEATPEGGTNNRTQTGANTMPQTGIEDPQDLVGPRDQQATRGETERLSQGTRLEERTPEIGGVEEIATGRTTTGKRNSDL